jgi:hypothetical protein
MSGPDPADLATGATIAPMPKTTMLAAKIRALITLYSMPTLSGRIETRLAHY